MKILGAEAMAPLSCDIPRDSNMSEAKVLQSYIKHLLSDLDAHSSELLELCKTANDVTQTKMVAEFFKQKSHGFTDLVQQQNSDRVSASDSNEVHVDVSSDTPNTKFNVDAPCFIPSKLLLEESVDEDLPSPLYNVWPSPPLSFTPWPQHLHLSTFPTPTSLFTGFQASGMTLPIYTPPQYYTNNLSLISGLQGSFFRSPYSAPNITRHRRRPRIEERAIKQVTENGSDCQNREVKSKTSPAPPATKPSDTFPVIRVNISPQIQSNEQLKEVPVPEKISSLLENVDNATEKLEDFPALSTDTRGVRKSRVKLPRVKFLKNSKLNLNELIINYNKTEEQEPSANKNLASSYSFQHIKKPNAPISMETRKSSNNQVSDLTHSGILCDKIPEDLLDEADGWKKVKPRFNKNKENLKHSTVKEGAIGVHPCNLCCQSTYHRRYESSNKKKHVNIGRKPNYSPKQYGTRRNNRSTGPNPTLVLDLHYNNMLAPSNVAHRSGKINNDVNTAKNDQVLLGIQETVTNVPTVTEAADVTVAPPQQKSPVNPPLECKSTVEINTDSLNSGLIDEPVGTLIRSSILDDDFSQNHCPTLSTTVSSSSIVDNDDESNADNQNNLEFLGDLSMDDENTVNDSMPVVEDAEDMHEEFMKYLNCSTWPTQMDEIDKFESMIAGNNPSDPVLMYPSVSVEQFTEFIQRHPGEAQAFRREITFKLSKIRETESKQQQAYEKRLELLKSKTDKVRGFVQKVKDVQLAQDRLALKRKHQIDEKLRKAEENRKNYLSIIRRKAHDEEEKLKEIAFINELEAQNRRHDSLALRQEHEGRLQVLIDERQRKVEEKAAKEAAAEERRRVIEAERQQKLMKIAEARRIKEEEIDRKQQERENQRLEMAREKAREREERLQARDAAQRATAEELQKRIQQKQEESARRHEENIESIRQRALEVGLHRNTEESSVNLSPVSKVEEPTQVELENSQESPQNTKQKAMKKKRLRKIRLRLTSKAAEFISQVPFTECESSLFGKALADLVELRYNLQPGGAIKIASLRDTLVRCLKNEPNTLKEFAGSRGFQTLGNLMKELISPAGHLNPQDIPSISAVIEIYRAALLEGGCFTHFVRTNDVMLMVDILRCCLAGLSSTTKWLNISVNILLILTFTLSQPSDDKAIISSLTDICGYAINVGLVEKIIAVFQDTAIGTTSFIALVKPSVNFYSSMLCQKYKSADLLQTLIQTECFGTIPLLYESLQKLGTSEDFASYVAPIVNLLLQFAELDVLIFQDALGGDGMALQMRAIARNLINYANINEMNKLLQAVLLLVGFFAIRNFKNQTLLQSGQQPTVLQQMVTLPIRYFCDQEYIDFLFPVLYVCSYDNPTNQAIVENDMSFTQLVDYVNSERGRKTGLMKLFHNLEQR